MAFPLPDKPSIAVLPFSNMSDDPEQEYFVDGMTEDLITDLSKLSGLFVIARNSVFIYKGKAVKVSEVAEELGVRYVLEGSVRRAGERVRINVQLIDATTSGHQWAERYDGSLEDIFGLQDRVTQKIVAALAINLTVEEESARAEIQTKDSMAYDAFLQGWEYYRRDTADDFVQAASYFEKAIELDPGYGRAHAALAAVYWNSASRGWTRVFEIRPGYATELSRQHLHEAMKQPSALAHQVASERAALYKHRPDTALAEAERAITLDSNDPAGHLAMANALLKAGKPGQAMESMHQAMRLDPHFPASYLRRLARVELALGQFQEAATALEQAASRNPDDDWTFVFLAAAYGHLGREDEAKAAVDQANAIRARVGRGPLVLQTIHRWRVTDEELILEGLANAGVENEPGEWMSLVTQKLSEYEVDGAEKLDVVKAKALHDGGVPFVDVSRPGNWLTGRIPGAIHLGLGGLFFEELLSEVRLLEIANRNQGIVIYCSNPNCSAAPFACAKALMWGFQNVYYFAGGALEWKAAGFPIQKGEENR